MKIYTSLFERQADFIVNGGLRLQEGNVGLSSSALASSKSMGNRSSGDNGSNACDAREANVKLLTALASQRAALDAESGISGQTIESMDPNKPTPKV